MTRSTVLNLNPDEYNEGLRYYPIMAHVDRYNGSCNTMDNPSARIFFQTKQAM